TRGVLIGVGVEDLALRADLLHLGLEARAVLLLVSRRLGLRQQQGDLAALLRAAATACHCGRARAVGLVVVAATRGDTGGERPRREQRECAPHDGSPSHTELTCL